MKIKIVTAIFSNLFGTDLGGRMNRGGHYRHSLKSLLKMSDADFVCYTKEDEIEDLKHFFYEEHNFTEDKIKFKLYDLYNFEFSEKIKKIKNIDEVKKSDRCSEIQYSKFIWCMEECKDESYDYVFWFDAGLSHCGIIPPKYRPFTTGYWETYYESTIFDNKFINNMAKYSDDGLVICLKENQKNFWMGTVPSSYYKDYDNVFHIIGGFFGGKIDQMKKYCNLFFDYLNKLLDNETVLYAEENIMTVIYFNHNYLFKPKYFEIWWHEGLSIEGLDMIEYTKINKSFYKVLEEFA